MDLSTLTLELLGEPEVAARARVIAKFSLSVLADAAVRAYTVASAERAGCTEKTIEGLKINLRQVNF